MKDAPLMASCMPGMHSTMLSLVTSSTGTREKVDVILNTNGGGHSARALGTFVIVKSYQKKRIKSTKTKTATKFYFVFLRGISSFGHETRQLREK